MGIVFWDSFRRWRAHSTKILIRVARTDRSAIVGSEHRWCVQLGASNRGILQLTQYSTDCLQGMNPCAVSQSSLSKYNFNHIWTAHQQEKKKKKKTYGNPFSTMHFHNLTNYFFYSLIIERHLDETSFSINGCLFKES